jgi:hypothetical protein
LYFEVGLVLKRATYQVLTLWGQSCNAILFQEGEKGRVIKNQSEKGEKGNKKAEAQ